MVSKNFLFITLIILGLINSYALQTSHGQSNKPLQKTIIKHLKRFELDQAEMLLDKYNNDSFFKSILKNELLFYQKGINTYLRATKKHSLETSYFSSVIYCNYTGDYYSRKLNPNDSLAFKNYVKAFALAKKYNDTLLVNESLKRINFFFLKNFEDRNLYKSYIEELGKYKQDKIDAFWVSYFTLIYDMTYSSFTQNEYQVLEKRFLKLSESMPVKPYFRGTVNQIIGVFYTYKPDIKSSRLYFEKAYNVYSDSSYYFNRRKIKAKFSIATLHYDEKNYNALIEDLKILLKHPLIQNDLELKKMTFEWLKKSYDTLNDNKNRRYYSKLLNQTNTLINSYAQAESAREIDVKNKVKETNEENLNLKNKTKSLKTSLMTVVPILTITLFILIFIFYLYKRYKKKSAILENKQSETLLKLDELKSVVIKNHIILKDKTKVYISDLMYIKSDDHYLEIFTQDSKKHTVRGKLNRIKEELPPNFIQCHRSYIVNSNYIKQVNSTSLTLITKGTIPLSRSYKNKF